MSDPKVTVRNLFAHADTELDEINFSDATKIFDVQEEADFVELIPAIYLAERYCNFAAYRADELPCKKFEAEKLFAGAIKKLFGQFKRAVNRSVNDMKYFSVDDLHKDFADISEYRAQNICEILIASTDSYRKNFSRNHQPLFAEKTFANGLIRYRFNAAMRFYFAWVEKIFKKLVDETHDGQFYITNAASTHAKETNTVLGILEALSVLTFKMTGGANSQLYIHINQIRNLKKIVDDRANYSNKILSAVALRHKLSVTMLTHIYEGNFTDAQIWDLLEDYFLGKIPAEVLDAIT